MNLPNPTFCLLPWISLETTPVGTVRPCCLAAHEITDTSGQAYQLTKCDLAKVRDSAYMQNLRQEFLAGQRPKTCDRCWREEASGRTSKRQHTIARLASVITNPTQWTAAAESLQFLDLKLGNVCNLRCRICGSWSSSTYAVEELAHSERPKETFHYQMLRAGSWPKNNDVFWSQVAEGVADLRYIEFTGGEPFMIPEHFAFLERLVDLGVAGQIEIHYNTNGTIYPEEAPAIWSHFKLVEIAVSIDDVGPRFEYQRKNAIWAEVQATVARFQQLRDRQANITLQVCATVNALNVLYLAELAQWIEQQAFDFVYWNMLHSAEYFSIAHLPEAAKQLAQHRLEQAQVSADTQAEFARIIEFMRQGAAADGSELCRELVKVDQRRGENIAKALPELAGVLGL